MTGSQEVSGSIPLISTTKNLEAATASRFFHVYGKLHKAVFVLNYKFLAISFISGRCLVTPRRCRPPWCHPKKSYLHCLIGKAGRYPIEYHNTPHIFLSPNPLFVTAPRLDIRYISTPPSAWSRSSFLVKQPSQIQLPPLECDVRLDSFPVEVTAASDVEVVSPRQLQIKRGLLWCMARVKAFNGFQAAVL